MAHVGQELGHRHGCDVSGSKRCQEEEVKGLALVFGLVMREWELDKLVIHHIGNFFKGPGANVLRGIEGTGAILQRSDAGNRAPADLEHVDPNGQIVWVIRPELGAVESLRERRNPHHGPPLFEGHMRHVLLPSVSGSLATVLGQIRMNGWQHCFVANLG
jgi:hypothetical protein